MWGTTNKICYEEGFDGTPWMNKLFSTIEKLSWCRSITLSEYFQEFEPRGLVYMPTASYDKMSYWVLPTPERISLDGLINQAKSNKLDKSEEIIKFLRGGFWRQFLVKYYEANNMHKKMLYVHEKFRFIERKWGRNERTKKALREILKAQCNDPYWHGQFGGVYFAFMRHNIYNYLIKAEKLIDKISETHIKITPAVHPYDIDKDGREEILLETSLITLYFHPFRGGSVYEIDHKEKAVNILNTFQRRKEAYYSKDLKYVVDRWRRYAFYDHFVDDKISLEDLIKDKYTELGTFLQKHYTTETNQAEKFVSVRLYTDGIVTKGKKVIQLRINKLFEVFENKNEIRTTIVIENKEKENIQVDHLTEIPIYLTGDVEKILFKCDKSESKILTDEKLHGKTVQMYAEDMNVKVKIDLSKSSDIFKYNLNTYATTNGGYNTLYQGTVLAFKTPINLKPEKIYSWKINISLD
ncbi:MAG: alpha-amylase/4-alpha-glucanotransferase domain-containing protein [Promethearchaeota archaeon]